MQLQSCKLMETVTTETRTGLTPEQYRAIDANVEDARFEYDGTRAYMMAGASVEHNQLATDIATTLNVHHQERACNVFQSDMRVRVDSRYTYPDVVMLCAEPEITDEDPPSLLNPELLVEVLSDATEDRDRTWKLDRYLEIDTLRECWLVETGAPRVVQYARGDGDAWTRRVASGADATFTSFGAEMALAEIYRRLMY